MTDYIINYTDPLKGSFTIKPYTSNGNKFPTTAAKESTAVSANSPLQLYGKGHPNYGERTSENLFHLVENFSGASPPIIDAAGNTIPGSFWHKETLYYYENSTTWYQWTGSWVDITASVMGPAQPGTPSDADFWYDGVDLYRYSDDEREIQSWVQVAHEADTVPPPASPTREMYINHDGSSTSWVAMPDTNGLDSRYLRLDGTFPMTDSLYGINGTSAAPMFSFNTDNNAGMYSIGVGIVGFSAASSERLRITSGVLSVDGGGADSGYAALVTAGAENDIPNRKYVDDLVAGAVGADTFTNSGSFSAGTLTLNYNTGGSHPVTGFNAVEIPFTFGSPTVDFTTETNVEDAINTLDTNKASLSNGAVFTGAVQRTSIPTAGTNDLATTNYVDTKFAGIAPYTREIVTGTTNPVVSFSTITYTTGEYRLMVFKNGIKLYADDVSGSPIVPYGYAEIDTSGSPYTIPNVGFPADGILLATAPVITDVFEIILT